MPTLITSGNHGDSLQGSAEKRVDIAPDGTLWALIVTQGSPGAAKFFKSTNGGATWAYVSSDISLEQSSAVPSFYIDADGYAHVSWVKWDANPQVVRYARGAPITGGGWMWTYLTISPASGRTGVDSDVIAFRSGTGWRVWVSYGLGSAGGAKVAQLNVTASGALSVTATQHGPTLGAVNFQFGSLEFNHTGDGKTASASPDVYLVTGVQGSASEVRANRAIYSAGSWTWDTPVQIDASAQIDQTTLTSAWDGSRMMIAWSEGTSTIQVKEWDGVTTVTTRNPPAAPGGTGTVLGLSLSVDPDTDDVYLAYYDATDGDIRWSKFTRGTTTWSAWAVAISRSGSLTDDGKVQLVKHPTRDSVDMIYATGGGTSWSIYSSQLAALVRSPAAPTLVYPASGANLDLAAGVTFRWTYNPVSPGDTQQAWAFRRIYGATTEYWNAGAQTWGGSIVWNTSVAADPAAAPFAAAKWANGTTYTWSVRTRSSTGADSAFAPDRTVIGTAAPVVDVTAPIGLVYGETTPLVEWTYTGLDAQASYEVRILVEDPAIDNTNPTGWVWTSGVVNSSIARQHRVAFSLTNGVAYRAYVRSTSATAVASPWDYSPFTISVTPPAGPLIEISDAVRYETDVPYVRLDLTAQSSFLTAEQDEGTGGWDVDANCTIDPQAANTGSQIFQGFKMTSVASGLMGAVTEVGDPPEAPFGQPALAGPLSFPVVAGVAYSGVVAIKAAATTRAARVSIRWYDADDGTGSLISTSVGEQEAVTSAFYVGPTVVAVAPVGAVLARFVIEVLGPTAASEVFYLAFPSFAPGRAATWSPGGYSTTQTLRVQRSVDDGVTWTTIIDRLKPNLAQKAVGSDRLMPFGIDVKYRAYTDIDPGAGAILSSGSSLVATLLVDAPVWAVRDPAEELAEFNAYVIAHKRSDDESSSVHYPSGREFPVVDTEGIHGARGTLSIYVKADDVVQVTEVLRRVVPMVAQSPAGAVYLVRMIRRDYKIEDMRNRVIDVDYVEIG